MMTARFSVAEKKHGMIISVDAIMSVEAFIKIATKKVPKHYVLQGSVEVFREDLNEKLDALGRYMDYYVDCLVARSEAVSFKEFRDIEWASKGKKVKL